MKKKTILFLLIISIFIMAFAFLNQEKVIHNRINAKIEKMEAPAQATATDNIANGTSGTCSWLIDKNGKLIIWPTNDTSGILDNIASITSAPWYSRREIIKEVEFLNGVKANANSCMGLFYGCSNLESVDLGNFDTSDAQDMSFMFEGCTSINELDISNLDTRNSTNLISFFPTKLNKIKLGANTNLKVNTNYGYPFGRGTWKKVEDGKEYSIIEICNNSLTGNAAGTYTKVSNISKEMVPTYSADYSIESLNEISRFTTTNPEIFELVNNNLIVKNIPVSNNDDYTVTGSCEILFKDKVVAKNDNTQKYDLIMKLENIHLYDLIAVDGVTTTNKRIMIIDNGGIRLSSHFYNSIDDVINNNSRNIDGNHSSIAFDITMKIVDKNGNAQNGSFIFSAYDLDVSSWHDRNSTYPSIVRPNTGYGEYSEGVTLLKGFDTTTKIFAQNTSLRESNVTYNGNSYVRYYGVRPDCDSEFSEFIIKANANETAFRWSVGGDAATRFLSYYQPKNVEISKQDQNGNYLKNAVLKVYYNNEVVEEWTTTNANKVISLNPGRYVLKEEVTPEGYTKANDIIFYVDTNNIITVNGQEVEKIVMKDIGEDTSVIVHHYIMNPDGTTTETKVPLANGGVAEDETINGKVSDEYDTEQVDVPEYYELVEIPGNSTGNMTKNQITVIYYYKLKKYPYKVNYYDIDTKQPIRTAKDGDVKEYGSGISVNSEKVNIENYNYVSATIGKTNETEGTSLSIGTNTTENVINLYYKQKKQVKVITKHVDEATNEEINNHDGTSSKVEETKREGDSYTTTSKEFDNYVLDTNKLPSNAEGTANEDETIVTYYYKHISGGVIEKHIDFYTDEVLNNEVHEGNEGDPYDIKSKTFEGYELMEDKLPSNAIGEMTKDPIEVKYYYKRPSKLVVDYIEKDTGKKLTDTITQDLYNGENYTTENKSFDGYELVQIPSNSKGVMGKETINVVYEYQPIKARVTVKYVDENGKTISATEIIEGKINDTYKTNKKDIANYKYVKVEGKTNGTMKEKETIVTYVYKKVSPNTPTVLPKTGNRTIILSVILGIMIISTLLYRKINKYKNI